MIKEKLKFYFLEADKHIEKIEKSLHILKKFYPLNIDKYEEMNELEKDKIDILIFRFSKLQDLIGEKIFRNILNLMGYNTNKPFIEILAELEKENLIEIQKWIALRNARNSIAHEYPYQEDVLFEAINFIIENTPYLIEVSNNLKKLYYEIISKRY